MKKIILSAAVAAMAFSTSAMAADKGIDITTNGQAVIYYQTKDTNAPADKGFFDTENSNANAGIQLDLGADLGNDFTFGSQVSVITTAGLERNLVDGVMQGGLGDGDTTNDVALTKLFVAKKVGNTTVKLGRQELPKSLSPLAYTEGWNVFKNTFDAIVAINTDLPKTTLVGAFVSSGTGVSDLSTSEGLANGTVGNGAYMLTASTTLVPMSTVTASYYTLKNVDAMQALGAAPATWGTAMVTADAIWVDAQVKPMDMLNVGLQYGNLDHDGAGAEDTTAYGIKVGANAGAISGYIAYTDVNDGDLPARNYGTMDKTPLYTQMVLTEDSASLDASAVVAAVSYNMGDMGNVMLRYGQVDAGTDNQVANLDKESELDLIYTVKAGGVNYFAAYVMQDRDLKTVADTDLDVIRFWARYNF